MCQECQKEMSRPVKFILAVLIIGFSSSVLYLFFQPGGFDPMKLVREHQHQIRMEAMKVEGYTAIGPSISWQSSEGYDIPIAPPPPPEAPDFPLPPAK